MPRTDDEKKRWVGVEFEQFYNKADPWNIKDDDEEYKKAERILSLMVTDNSTDIDKFDKGIDLGCGEGHFTNLYADRCQEMIGCDLSGSAVKRAQERYGENVSFFQWDLLDCFPEKINGQFDLVLCNEVLYYIEPENYDSLTRNIYSLMRPDGSIIISVGHYFTISDIEKLFDRIDFTKTIQKESKGTYSLMMSGLFK
jgi:2-polyprenyl-3-methyl-5-hydroxy-6-metoxy-1,4-benzoquinol methylase